MTGVSDPGFWSGIAGGSGGMLALVGGWFKLRTSREARFYARYDKRFEELESEVEDCKKRDARMLIVETCLRLSIPVMLHVAPDNPTLRQVAALLRSLPAPENGGEWLDWINRLDAADEASRS